ncbi:GTPase-associated protein 1-related protein [Streptomyces sp. NPDC000410]|uniref:GTPase-associated protein 1-related protein n=1 Tax=Streptomyces sp. NPDC000410 TaxID=3154254 RepID=UPI00332AE6F2
MTGEGSRPVFQQLYYTSCERGLTGFSGFQFNAVSAGVSAETMHTVETLAGYDPPRSLVESDTPQQLARCPVSLCFVPSGPSGKGATVLNVRYVGRDSARRFGNYFAHALHSDDFAAAGGGMLGIELWDSSAWTTERAPATEIPALGAAPPRGPLTPRAVQGFLREHPHADQLPCLLAAVFTALAEDRSVVVVDSSTDRIAHWFAAVSYLLPPRLARRLSFTTYLSRPTRSRLHLIGTVPEAEAGIGPDEQESYPVFDFTTGRFPDAVPLHYLVRLLVRIGVRSIGPVWSWTAEYADGEERHLGDWHAPVAAAAAAGGIALTAEDVAAVVGWLGGAAHLGSRRAVVARDIYLKHRGLDDGRLAALSAAALAGGDLALHQELEGTLHESRMRAYLTGAEEAAAPVPIADPALRERAAELWLRLLDEAVGVRQRVRHLLWAHGARLDPPAEVVGRVGRELARGLLDRAATHAVLPSLQREVGQLMDHRPEFRTSLAAAVAELVGSRGGQHQLFSQFPAALLDEGDLRDHPRLLEHYWIARAEREPATTVAVLFRILRHRGRDVPDAELLDALWRRTPWSYEEAGEIALALPQGRPVGPAVGEYFTRTLRQEISDQAGLTACLHLCELLSVGTRFLWLPPDTAECVAVTLARDTELRTAVEATRLADAFAVPLDPMWAPPRALKLLRLADTLVRLRADPAGVPKMVRRLDFGPANAYLHAVRAAARGGGRIDDVLLGHVAGLALVGARTGLPDAHRAIAADVRRHAADQWRTADTERLAERVRPYDARLTDWLVDRAEQRVGAPKKLLRRFTGRRPTSGDPGPRPGGEG